MLARKISLEFAYNASDNTGKPIAGKIDARDEAEVISLLRKQGLTPLSVDRINQPQIKLKSRKASAQDKVLAMRELATLLIAGVSLIDSVQSLASARSTTQMGQYFSTIQNRLRSGAPLSQALISDEVEWPPYVKQLIIAGEQTGRLGKCLEDAASQLEYEESVRQEVRSALIYPAILVVSGIIATLIVFIVVVPRFANLLRTGRAELPFISIWVLKAGLFTQAHLIEILLFIAICSVLLWGWLRKALQQGTLYAIAARVPLLGELLMQNQIGIWAEMMGNLLENKVPLLNALELSNSTVKSAMWRHRINTSTRSVRSGKPLAESMQATNLFDSTALNLIVTGEKSGQLPLMLRTLARMRRNSAKENTRRFLALVEPAAILLIGAVIGTIMIAVMMAITSINNISF